MIKWAINAFQGQWHKLFSHPAAAIELTDQHQPGIRQVRLTCKECGRSFPKQLCGTCGR